MIFSPQCEFSRSSKIGDMAKQFLFIFLASSLYINIKCANPVYDVEVPNEPKLNKIKKVDGHKYIVLEKLSQRSSSIIYSAIDTETSEMCILKYGYISYERKMIRKIEDRLKNVKLKNSGLPYMIRKNPNPSLWHTATCNIFKKAGKRKMKGVSTMVLPYYGITLHDLLAKLKSDNKRLSRNDVCAIFSDLVNCEVKLHFLLNVNFVFFFVFAVCQG